MVLPSIPKLSDEELARQLALAELSPMAGDLSEVARHFLVLAQMAECVSAETSSRNTPGN